MHGLLCLKRMDLIMNLIDTLRPFTSFPPAFYYPKRPFDMQPIIAPHQRYLVPHRFVERWRELDNDYAPYADIELEGYNHELN